jgi:uncharacterized protein YacL
MLIIAIIGTIVTPLLAMLLTAMLSCEDTDINKLGTFIGIPLTVFMCLATMDSIIAAYKQITATKIESIDWSQVQVNEYRENDKVVKITYTIGDKTFELPVKEN